ncbi:MAG: DUF5693 family protein [Vulcanimicrobiaceae bacterium]
MNLAQPKSRFTALILLIALLASLVVAYERIRIEQQTRRVELAMDYNDFVSLARSYNYNPNAFLIELQKAGLTSLALSEELGSNVGASPSAYATSGVALLNNARLSPLADPTLRALLASKQIRPDEVYLLVFDKPTFDRYMTQLPFHFERSGIHVLHRGTPYVIALRTQMDYFGSISLGIPADQLALAKRLKLLIVPRFQNDERLSEPQIKAMFKDLNADHRLSTVIFFGLRNQVLGFPDHLKDTADVFKSDKTLNFGEIETYDPSQVQKGNDELARLIPGRTVRVQAISKVEQDKLLLPQIVARYELGARERNVRVVYLRPFGHQYNSLSIEKSNVELVRQIADDLKSHGFKLGRAAPIPLYRGNSAVLVGLSALAVPALFVLLLQWYGWYRRGLAVAAYVLTALIYLGGHFAHHDLLGRSIIALAGALLFATAAFTVLSRAFYEEPAPGFGAQLVRSLKWTLLATAVALLGALVVIGVMSSPLVMEEIERFRGVKAVLAAPPLIALFLYILTDRFNSHVEDPKAAFAAPIRIYQLIVAVLVVGIGGLVLIRSGNQGDIAPSDLELALRHHLTVLLSVRPRFKEFVIGFPLLMLLPALTVAHRRAVGLLLALGIGVGIGDVIDTFSHLHTPVLISLLRVFNGFVIGAVIGAILIAIYRALLRRISSASTIAQAPPTPSAPPVPPVAIPR